MYKSNMSVSTIPVICYYNGQIVRTKTYVEYVRPEKFQFLEKGQNRNFDYKIVISVKNP